MAVVQVDSNNFTLQVYNSQDENLISSTGIDTVLTGSSYIEFFIYENNSTLSFQNYSYINYSVENDSPSTGLNAISQFNINPESDCQTQGFDRGDNITYYNFLNKEQVSKMKKIIKPLYRGWDNVDGERKQPSTDKKIIVFNHRPNTYKSYPWFLKQMDKLWKQRQDFKVWVPLADTQDREYISIDKFNRQGYFTELSKCWVGVCGKSYHKGWVNSAADGMSVGTPYIFLNENYYSETIKDSGIYFSDDNEFMIKINKILDDENYRKKYSKKSKETAKENTWDITIKKYNEHFLLAEKKLKQIKEKTESYKKIVSYIIKKVYV